jgi:F-type H+-transporting ATPase subunit gamma
MAGGQERILRRRIKSIQSTKKITKAMELIAASQIVRAQGRMLANRPYRAGMARIVVEVAIGDPTAAEKLLGTPESPERVGILVLVADRGLSGAYNSSVLRAAERLATQLRASGATVTVYTVGKKAQSYFRYRGQDVAQSFVGISERPTFADARVVASAVATPFVNDEIDQLLLVSTHFVSSSSQAVQTRQLLPLPDPNEGQGEEGEVAPESGGARGYTEFEPDVEDLLAVLAPKAVESEIFSALLEGSASFFTAQQRAMAAATDNADDLITRLSRVMNRARQDAITTEIMEIVGGAEALRHSKGA